MYTLYLFTIINSEVYNPSKCHQKRTQMESAKGTKSPKPKTQQHIKRRGYFDVFTLWPLPFSARLWP